MDDPTAPASAHELLLRLAGRVDDDLLAEARELVAVGEDGQAVELVTAALAAERTPLPPPVRAELVAAAQGARIDLDADAALAQAGPDPTDHRFTPYGAADADDLVLAAAREVPPRLLAGVRLRLAWRLTPAGSAPVPPPYPVLLVECPEEGRPGEVLAYQLHEALRRAGLPTAVEVLTSGRPLTSYHAAALRDSVAIARRDLVAARWDSAGNEQRGSVAADLAPVDGPRAPESSPRDADVVAPEADDTRSTLDRESADERSGDLFGAAEPVPRPVPLRNWQSGRRRRAFAAEAPSIAEIAGAAGIPELPDVAVDPGPSDDHVHDAAGAAVGDGPLPSPVPLARRRLEQDPAAVEPFAVSTLSAPSDPLVGPLHEPLLDPVLDPVLDDDPAPDHTVPDSAVPEDAVPEDAVPEDAVPDALPDDPASGDAVPDGARSEFAEPDAPVPAEEDEHVWAGDWAGGDWSTTEPVRRAAPSSPESESDQATPEPVDAPALLKPESVARLGEADRDLLARLQAELRAARSDVGAPRARRSGAHALRTADVDPPWNEQFPADVDGSVAPDADASGQRATPPNLAG